MLFEKIQQDLKNAQLAKDEIKVSTLRLLLSELKYASLAGRATTDNPGGLDANLTDEQVVTVLQKEAKKRKEAVEGFRKGQREELARKEETELKILEQYLPAQLSDEELTKIVKDAIKDTNASSAADMGKVIVAVKSKVGQSADGGRVSQIVKSQLLQS